MGHGMYSGRHCLMLLTYILRLGFIPSTILDTTATEDWMALCKHGRESDSDSVAPLTKDPLPALLVEVA